jgi:hypothetical protein
MGEFTGPALNAMNTNIKISGIGVWGRSTLHIQYTAVVIYSSRGGWNSMDNCSIRAYYQEHDGVAVASLYGIIDS